MKKTIFLLCLLLGWGVSTVQATEIRMTIAYGNKAVANNDVRLHLPDSDSYFAQGKTDRNGRVTFQVSGPVPSRVDVYGSVRDNGSDVNWNVKGATAIQYDNSGGYYWAVLDLKVIMEAMNGAIDNGMEDSAFEDDPMFQMAKGVIKTSANSIEAAWGIPASTQYGTRPIYPNDPNFENGSEPSISTSSSSVNRSSSSATIQLSPEEEARQKAAAETAAKEREKAEKRRQEEEEKRRKKEEQERRMQEMQDNLGLFAGTYSVNFQSKGNKVPFNVYINGELATSFAATTQRLKVAVQADAMTDIRIEFEDGSVPAITRRAPIGAKDTEGNIMQTYNFTVKKKKNGKVVLNRRLM